MNSLQITQLALCKQANVMDQIQQWLSDPTNQRIAGGLGGAALGGGLGGLLGGGGGALGGAALGGTAGAFTPEIRGLIEQLLAADPEQIGFDTGGNAIMSGGPEEAARDQAAAISRARRDYPDAFPPQTLEERHASPRFAGARAQMPTGVLAEMALGGMLPDVMGDTPGLGGNRLP